jgi:hypothetical protein
MFALVPGLLLLWAIVKTLTEKRYYGQPVPVTKINPQYRARLQQWQALASTHARVLQAPEIAGKLVTDVHSALTPAQSQQLKFAIENSLYALNATSFDRYVYFKTNEMASPYIDLSALQL